MKNTFTIGQSCFSAVTSLSDKPSRLSGFLFLLLLALMPFSGIAGSFNMTNGIVTTSCSDYFYDSGGPYSNYGSNESKVVTIYPATPGAKVTVNFTSFDLEDYYDYLYVYDGSSTSASYVGAYSGTSGPGTITSTASDGTLTF